MKITILTTFYKNKQDVLKVYQNYKDNLSDKNIRYLFVNDNFEDEVWNEIERIAKSNKNITALCLDKNYGQLFAIKAGIEKISNGKVLYHDSDRTIDSSFIEQGLQLIDKDKNDIVWGIPKSHRSFLRSFFKIIYKLLTSKNYHYRSLVLMNENTLKILQNAYKSGEILYGEILNNLDLKKIKLNVNFQHNYKNSRYDFFSKFLLAIKHFPPYLEKIYLKSMVASSLFAFVLLIFLILTLFLKLTGFINFLPGWLSIILITICLNMILIFLICITSLFNIDQIKNLKKKTITITKTINES